MRSLARHFSAAYRLDMRSTAGHTKVQWTKKADAALHAAHAGHWHAKLTARVSRPKNVALGRTGMRSRGTQPARRVLKPTDFVGEPVVSRSFSMAKLLDMRLNALGSHPVSCSEYVAGLVQGRARHPRDGVHGFEPHRRRDDVARARGLSATSRRS